MRRMAWLRLPAFHVACLLILLGTGTGLTAGAEATRSDPAIDEVRALVKGGRYADAEAAARGHLERWSKAGASDTIDAARMTRLLVDALVRGGKAKDPETRQVALRQRDLALRLSGDSSADYADSLFHFGNFSFRVEEFDAARAAYAESLTIRERVFGAKSIEAAQTLSSLAAVEGASGRFSQCRSFIERALAIQEEVLGPDALPVAGIRHNYAIFLNEMGDTLGAQEEGERAIAIRTKQLPPDHPLTAMSMHNLALYKARLGDFAAAKQLYEQALAMQERSLGPDHPDVGQTLGNIAGILVDMGRLPEARAMYERSVAIYEKSAPERLSVLAVARSELAQVLAMMGETDRARALMTIALQSLEATFGPVHQDLAGTLLRLADMEEDQGHLEEARRHYERAVSIFESVFSPTHPFVARGLVGLAGLRLDVGDFDGADPLLRRALAIRETMLGPGHPDVARVRVDLARVAMGRDDPRTALQESLQAEGILRAHFDRVLSGLSEREALDYERVRASGLGIALAALASNPAIRRDGRLVERVWSELAGSRALVLDRIASRHRTLVTSEEPEVRAMARALAASTNRLASLVVSGPEPRRPEAYRKAVAEAAAERDRIERDIASRGGAFPAASTTAVTLSALRSARPDGAGLLAFVQYDPGPGAGARGTLPSRGTRTSYAAFVLRRDRPAPLWFDLGGTGAIDPLIDALMQQASRTAGAGSEVRYRDAAAAVRKRLWDPVAKALAGARTVFIVPDGSINLINFAALPDGEIGYLIERGPIVHYLSAERDLLRHATARPVRPGNLVMAAPEFDALPGSIAQAASPTPAGEATAAATPESPVYRGPTSECVDFSSLRFDPLPAALDEASVVETQWRRAAGVSAAGTDTVRLTGALASEEAFKTTAQRRGRLHLATHGFYLGSACGASAAPRPDTLPVFLRANPLLLSGIALAGANRRSAAPRGGEDGILTAEEIASLDLSGVDWAVLSGCETARGTIQAGEGIFGLRRAFEVAGARTLILSLWQVEDRATLDWMTALYERRGAGASTAQAVRDAGLSILQARRAKGRSTHPFYWGAFVSAGDWR